MANADPFLVKGRRSRAAPEPGDFFAFAFADPELAVFGRVIQRDAWQGSAHDLLIIYVYDWTATVAGLDAFAVPDLVPVSRLLIPPAMVSDYSWRSGHFRRLPNRPLRPEERLPRHHFRSSDGVIYDDKNNRVHPAEEPVGMWSESSAEAVALRAFRALDLRTSDGHDATEVYRSRTT